MRRAIYAQKSQKIVITEAQLMEYVLGGILILASLFLIVAVLLQSGKGKKGLSGAIAGGSDSFFGKNQADTNEKKLAKLTAIVAIVFHLVSSPNSEKTCFYVAIVFAATAGFVSFLRIKETSPLSKE